MNKEEYLKIIQKETKKINTDEKEDILSKYESYFINGYKNNKNDEEIIKELGDPVKIAKEINAVNSLYKVENKKSVKSIFSSAFSIMELSILNLILIISIFYTMTQVHNNHKVSGETILTLSTWLFAFWGVMIITSFLVRDFSQGTSQLYLNSSKNRVKYFISQLISILIASVIVFLTLYVFVLIMQNIGDGEPLKNEVVGKALGIYILLFLFYGLFLFLITLLVKSSSLVFSIGVFLILIIPIATNLVPLIPEYGDEVRKALKYIPFNFLINNVWLGSLKLNGWQTFISIASVILLAIIDFFTISKRDY